MVKTFQKFSNFSTHKIINRGEKMKLFEFKVNLNENEIKQVNL